MRVIREYRIEDWPEVLELYGDAVKELYGEGLAGYPAELLDSLFTPLRPGDITLGVVSESRGGRLEGYVVGHRLRRSVCKLSDVFFREGIRGTGIPLAAYKMFEALAGAKGFKFIVVGSSSQQKQLNVLIDKMGYKDFERYTYKELD